MHVKRILGACAASAILAPAVPALADQQVRPVVGNAITGAEGVTALATDAAHLRLVRRHMTVARRYADLKGITLDEPSLGAAHLANSSREVREATKDLRDKIDRLREERRSSGGEATGATAGSGSATGSSGSVTGGSGSGVGAASGSLQAIARCESGGDPGAVGGGGAYRGKYQFDRQTWSSVGGSGDPAAAPEAEQDRRAQVLLQRRGTSPWPVCGS